MNSPRDACHQRHTQLFELARTPRGGDLTRSDDLSAGRPGGYDVLFESLARQTSTDYELICIDDTGPMDKETGVRGPPARRATAVAYVRRRGVPLVALVPSKKKVRGLRFGQCNAINSGLVLAAGQFITVVQDNVWLLPNFVERTLAFFATHDRDVLLSYPERRVAPPPGRLNREWMQNTTMLRIFDPPVEMDPVEAGWEIQNFNKYGPRPRASLRICETCGQVCPARSYTIHPHPCARVLVSMRLARQSSVGMFASHLRHICQILLGACKRAHMHIFASTRTHTHRHTHTQTFARVRACKQARTHTHASNAHTRATPPTHTHTHVHTLAARTEDFAFYVHTHVHTLAAP